MYFIFWYPLLPCYTSAVMAESPSAIASLNPHDLSNLAGSALRKPHTYKHYLSSLFHPSLVGGQPPLPMRFHVHVTFSFYE